MNKLGSSDKILGVLQCYDYFAPLSKDLIPRDQYLTVLVEIGIKQMGEKQNHKKVMNNLAKITSDLRNLSNNMEEKINERVTEAMKTQSNQSASSKKELSGRKKNTPKK